MKRVVWVVIGLIAVSIVITLVTFTVREGECALVTQFGRPVRTIEKPGLNFKWPVPIQTVNRFDRRLQLFESRLVEFLTKDKKNVVLKFFVLWKLDKAKEFFLSVGNTATAEQKLDDILISKGGAAVGDYEFEDLISTKAESKIGELEKRIQTDLEAQTLRDYGYGIQKVGISRLALPEANAGSVFNRMRAERKAIANKYRAEGEQQAAAIRAKADREKSDLISEASRQAQIIRGKGEAEAAKIYAEAFKHDPEFYQFWRTLDSYRSILDSNTALVLSEDSELFKYLRR
jgi:membrane protease subunit HflC